MYIHLIPAVLTVGFDSTVYTVSESDGSLQVCATVIIPNVGCPTNTSFSVNVTVSGGTAGISNIKVGSSYINDCGYVSSILRFT